MQMERAADYAIYAQERQGKKEKRERESWRREEREREGAMEGQRAHLLCCHIYLDAAAEVLPLGYPQCGGEVVRGEDSGEGRGGPSIVDHVEQAWVGRGRGIQSPRVWLHWSCNTYMYMYQLCTCLHM